MAARTATRILVVDDDPEIRFLIHFILSRTGEYELTEAIHGRAALDAIAVPPAPDIIVTDLMMPVMTGMELIRRLREDPMTAGIRIVVVSANVAAEEGDEIRGAVDGLVSKESIYPQLLAAVRRLEPGVKARSTQ